MPGLHSSIVCVRLTALHDRLADLLFSGQMFLLCSQCFCGLIRWPQCYISSPGERISLSVWHSSIPRVSVNARVGGGIFIASLGSVKLLRRKPLESPVENARI